MRFRHLLFPTELSSCRLFPGQAPDFVRRNTDTQRAPRQPGSHEPGHKAERRTRLMQQTAVKGKYFLLRRREILFAAECVIAAILPQFERCPGDQQLSNKILAARDWIVRNGAVCVAHSCVAGPSPGCTASGGPGYCSAECDSR